MRTSEALNLFLQELKKNHSRHTVRAYSIALRQVFGHADLETLNAAELAKLLSRWQGRTLSSRLSAVKKFLQWLKREDLASALGKPVLLPAPEPAKAQKEAEKLLEIVLQLPLREKAFFLTMIDLKLRPGEVLALDSSYLLGDMLYIPGDIPRLVKMTPRVKELLHQLADPKGGYIFRSKGGKPVSYDAVYRWWLKVQEKARVDFSMDSLRQLKKAA